MPNLSRLFALALTATATLHPRESLFGSGSLAAPNAEVICAADGCSTLGLRVSNAYVGTLVVEGSVDAVNWDPVPIKNINLGGTWQWTLASAATGRFQGPIGPFRFIKVRMSAWTSGQADVMIVAENGVADVVAQPKCADLSVTNTGASGAAVTLTLPAPGVNLFHRLMRLQIDRFAAAALTAAATPVVITTTNLPGARAFTVAADALTLGQKVTEPVFEPGNPLRSSASNTATTIVAPVTTGVIWRLTADYDVAPF